MSSGNHGTKIMEWLCNFPTKQKGSGKKVGNKNGKLAALSISTIHIKKYIGVKKIYKIPFKIKCVNANQGTTRSQYQGRKKPQPKQYNIL